MLEVLINVSCTPSLFLFSPFLFILTNTPQDRFWLTTRIYPSRTDSTRFGIYVGNNASVEVSDLSVWTGLANIFPERPLNSSSALVWDSPEETNNYTYWTGN